MQWLAPTHCCQLTKYTLKQLENNLTKDKLSWAVQMITPCVLQQGGPQRNTGTTKGSILTTRWRSAAICQETGLAVEGSIDVSKASLCTPQVLGDNQDCCYWRDIPSDLINRSAPWGGCFKCRHIKAPLWLLFLVQWFGFRHDLIWASHHHLGGGAVMCSMKFPSGSLFRLWNQKDSYNPQ